MIVAMQKKYNLISEKFNKCYTITLAEFFIFYRWRA